jgi:hypothetical protein
MPSLINRKKDKAFHVLEVLGDSCSESEFIEKFKELYASDWKLIQQTYEEEEHNTKPWKNHPMPHPDIYMKEMYRNFKNRRDVETKLKGIK